MGTIMDQRYEIYREYFGKFDEVVVIAITDCLMDAVFICESLNRVFEDRPYNFNFIKIVEGIDQSLDYVPGEGFLESGKVMDCCCLEDYHNQTLKKV